MLERDREAWTEGGREREREGGRERETETERPRNRETEKDRQTDRDFCRFSVYRLKFVCKNITSVQLCFLFLFVCFLFL